VRTAVGLITRDLRVNDNLASGGASGSADDVSSFRSEILTVRRECPIRCVGMTKSKERHVYEDQH